MRYAFMVCLRDRIAADIGLLFAKVATIEAAKSVKKTRHCFDFQYRDLMSRVTDRPQGGKYKRNANYSLEDNYRLGK
jgi:hypothetical protein